MNFLCTICVHTEVFLCVPGLFLSIWSLLCKAAALRVPRSGEADLWPVLPMNEVWSPMELCS